MEYKYYCLIASKAPGIKTDEFFEKIDGNYQIDVFFNKNAAGDYIVTSKNIITGVFYFASTQDFSILKDQLSKLQIYYIDNFVLIEISQENFCAINGDLNDKFIVLKENLKSKQTLNIEDNILII